MALALDRRMPWPLTHHLHPRYVRLSLRAQGTQGARKLGSTLLRLFIPGLILLAGATPGQVLSAAADPSKLELHQLLEQFEDHMEGATEEDYRHQVRISVQAATPIAPGLLLIGNNSEEEVNSARRFAEYLFPRFGLTVVLITAYNRFNIPGFDGLIVNADRDAVANFSLKTIHGHPGAFLVDRFAEADRQMRRFSVPQGWLEYLFLVATRDKETLRAGFMNEVNTLPPLFTMPRVRTLGQSMRTLAFSSAWVQGVRVGSLST
ncbi:MAG: hypothetical protein AB7G93_20550 [Bdellovibrionales bacterium]